MNSGSNQPIFNSCRQESCTYILSSPPLNIVIHTGSLDTEYEWNLKRLGTEIQNELGYTHYIKKDVNLTSEP
jgi:hypothetical protein